MRRILRLKGSMHRDAVYDLLQEYYAWARSRTLEAYGFDVDVDTLLANEMDNLGRYQPPEGGLFLAEVNGEAAGLVCLRRTDEKHCEVKRMYVRDRFRGEGLGQMLLGALLDLARETGYQKVFLDTAGFMEEAQALYRSAGFVEIDPYPGSELSNVGQLKGIAIFMEKELAA